MMALTHLMMAPNDGTECDRTGSTHLMMTHLMMTPLMMTPLMMAPNDGTDVTHMCHDLLECDIYCRYRGHIKRSYVAKNCQ